MNIETANSILDNVVNEENFRSFDIAVALAIRHMQTQIEDLHRQIASPRQETVCWRCGSWQLEGYETEGATGVVAPDGCREYRVDRGYRCLRCGASEEL